MADLPISRILTALNTAGIQQKQPAIYQAIHSLITAAETNQADIVKSYNSISNSLLSTLTWGGTTELNAFIPPNVPLGSLILFFDIDTSTLYVFVKGVPFAIGGNTNATYLTVTDETASLPNSRRELAGIGIQFDDTVTSIRYANLEFHPFLLMGV